MNRLLPSRLNAAPVLTEESCADAESTPRALRVATDIRSS